MKPPVALNGRGLLLVDFFDLKIRTHAWYRLPQTNRYIDTSPCIASNQIPFGVSISFMTRFLPFTLFNPLSFSSDTSTTTSPLIVSPRGNTFTSLASVISNFVTLPMFQRLLVSRSSFLVIWFTINCKFCDPSNSKVRAYSLSYGTRFQPHVSCRVYTALLALLNVLACSSVMYCYVLCVMVCAGCESYIIHNWHSSCRCVLHGGQGHVIVLWGLEYMFGLVCLCLFRRSWLKWGYDDT